MIGNASNPAPSNRDLRAGLHRDKGRAGLQSLIAVGALILFSAVALSGASAQGLPAAKNEAQAYDICLALAEQNPEAAYTNATDWMDRGGADPARHCAAVALIELGRYEEAGRRLESLAETMNQTDDTLRIDALAQAAQAWLLAGDRKRAFRAQSAALRMAPDDSELLVDRAIVLASDKNYTAALIDLNRANELTPGRSDVLVYRATVQRFLEATAMAMRDIQSAIRLDPEMPEAYLERGILKRLKGDSRGARRDWEKVLELGRESPVVEAARINLSLLEGEDDTRPYAPIQGSPDAAAPSSLDVQAPLSAAPE